MISGRSLPSASKSSRKYRVNGSVNSSAPAAGFSGTSSPLPSGLNVVTTGRGFSFALRTPALTSQSPFHSASAPVKPRCSKMLWALVPLIRAAVEHQGVAFIDVVSPCVAFNNHPGSTKSYDYVREHNEAVNRLDFISGRDEITAEYAAGTVTTVRQHDGSILRLRKLAADYDATDRIKVMHYLHERAAEGEVVTGLLYVDPESQDLHQHMDTIDTPLNQLGARDLCPGNVALEKINAALR